MGTPLAAFSGSNDTADDIDVLTVLSSGPSGIVVDGYDGSWQDGDWAPTDNPSILGNVQNYSTIAATDDAHVYALQGGNIVEFVAAAEDGITWSYVGKVK